MDESARAGKTKKLMSAVLPSPAMQAVGTLLVVAAALLAVAGTAKVLRPLPAVLAMGAVGLPSSPGLVRLLGLAEIAIGVVVVLTASPVAAALMAVAYLAFTWFVVASMRSEGGRSCGCFGETATPPGIGHIVVDLGAAAVSVAAVVVPAPSLGDLLDHGPVDTALVVGGSALAVYLLIAVLTTLPQAMRAVSEAASGGRS
jgi:uncharacterized membrane protein YphA (DoxX/SURF4 family)